MSIQPDLPAIFGATVWPLQDSAEPHNMTENLKLREDKAYVLVKLTSPTSIKPTVLTGFKVYDPARLCAKSTSEPPDTVFSIMETGPLLFDNHVISFRPKAGIHIGNAGQWIEVKSHSQDRQTLETSLRYFAQEDLQKDQEKHGEVKAGDLQYWKDVAGGEGATWMNANGGHVWWEVVDVKIAYED
jgi:hypothetical protein